MNELGVFPPQIRGPEFVPQTHVMLDLETHPKSHGELGDRDRILGGLWARWPNVCNSDQQERPRLKQGRSQGSRFESVL